MRRETHHAAGVVLFREERGRRRYLLLRSTLTRRPLWEFPKGGVEPGESERDAAERELAEETGLAPGEYALRDGFRAEERYVFTLALGEERTLVAKRVAYFLAEAATPRVRLSHAEASAFRWATYEEARRLLRLQAKQEVLDEVERWLGDGGG
jgi:bis(5'-nucleosidyl)-tetraphosphatase